MELYAHSAVPDSPSEHLFSLSRTASFWSSRAKRSLPEWQSGRLRRINYLLCNFQLVLFLVLPICTPIEIASTLKSKIFIVQVPQSCSVLDLATCFHRHVAPSFCLPLNLLPSFELFPNFQEFVDISYLPSFPLVYCSYDCMLFYI